MRFGITVCEMVRCAEWVGWGYFDATRYQDDSGMVHGRTVEQQSTPNQSHIATGFTSKMRIAFRTTIG
jgi:hypothetical protein